MLNLTFDMENIKQSEFKQKKIIDEAQAIADALKGLDIKISAKVGTGDKLFGSISNANVAEAVAAEGQEIEKKFITIAGGIVKRLGKYNASVRLHRDVIVELPFEVVAEQ